MSYQVIARKYRPQRFADVVGQEHVTRTLANAIAQNRIAHAYLFVGPRGTGKTTLARIFAKCLNSTGGPKVDFPDDDPRCQEIAEGRSLDVLEIDGASNRGIEEIRALRETVRYAPAMSRFKIYIIDEVHMLTKEAFNALLKTLEEPPSHVKFMFATTEPEKVLPTILSRCQRFDLRRIPTPLIAKHLAHISALESIRIDDAALHAIARGADGGMRDAESALDQLISFCGEEIVEADVLSMFGLAARGQVYGLADAILKGDTRLALQTLDELAKSGKDLGRLLADLLSHFRNLLLLQVAQGDRNVLDISDTELSALQEQTKDITVEAVTRILDLLSESEGRLRDAVSKRILVEVALLKAIQARKMVSIDTVLQKLKTLQSESPTLAAASPAAPDGARPSSPPAALAEPPRRAPPPPEPAPRVQTAVTMEVPPAPTPAAPISRKAPAAAVAAPELGDLWSKLVEAVGRASAFVRSYLLEAHPVSLVKNILTIGFDPEFADHLSLVDNPKNRALIQTKLQELGYPDLHAKFVQAETPAGWQRPEIASVVPAPAAAPLTPTPSAAPSQASEPKVDKPAPTKMSKEDFKNDPLIQKAIEIFKGQIIEVRA